MYIALCLAIQNIHRIFIQGSRQSFISLFYEKICVLLIIQQFNHATTHLIIRIGFHKLHSFHFLSVSVSMCLGSPNQIAVDELKHCFRPISSTLQLNYAKLSLRETQSSSSLHCHMNAQQFSIFTDLCNSAPLHFILLFGEIHMSLIISNSTKQPHTHLTRVDLMEIIKGN